MPLLWGNTRCAEAAGWEDRVARKLTVAGKRGWGGGGAGWRLAASSSGGGSVHLVPALTPFSSHPRTPTAGGVGVAVGSVLSVLQQQPLARFTAASTASFLMLAGCFSREPLPNCQFDMSTWCAAVPARCEAKPTQGGMHQQRMHLQLLQPAAALPRLPPPPAVVQEASRLVRCRDSPLNSVAAGAATGALLYKSHGGLRGSVRC